MVKPTRDECKKLVGRLMGLPFAPTAAAAVEVLIDTLEQAAESKDHATKVVDAFAMGSCERCPTGYDIRQKALDLRTTERRADPECEQCYGSGFRSVIKDGYSAADKCDCWRSVAKEPQ